MSAAVLGALLGLTASCAAQPVPPEQASADQALAQRVAAALEADPTYYYRHVDVRVSEGLVDLSGYVWSTEAIYRARRITLGVPGVREVVTSQLALERQGRETGIAR